MRVLLISNHFPPDFNPSGKLMGQLAEGLRAEGFSVDVLTTFPHYEGFRVADAHRGKLIEHERIGDDTITRVWSFTSGRKHKMLHRLMNYISFNGIAGFVGLRRRRYDVILANSGSFFTGVTSWLIDAARHTPFVYNVQDIYPDVPVRAGQLKNRVAIAGLERIESFMYRHAASVTVISREQYDTLRRKGVPVEKLEVIPNFVDTELVRPAPKDNEFSRAHQLDRKTIIGHAGNLGFAYDFDTLLDVAAELRDNANVEFLIVGEGVHKKHIIERIAAEQIGNVRLMPFQPEAMLPQLRATMDVQLALYQPDAAQSSLPSKIYEAMASGRPLLVAAEEGTELRHVVEETKSGLVVDPRNKKQLLAAVQALIADTDLRSRLGAQGRIAAETSFSKQRAVQRYATLFRRLTGVDKVHDRKQ
ncbi:MAG TPA: glycosyltransferase family 4 protein [Longimicrobiales bacterium]|nr:glycosyltransferase family 4 protein [Longimicrobiales bacterium]